MNFYRVAPICFMLLLVVLIGLFALVVIQAYRESEFISKHYKNADKWTAEVKEKGSVKRR